MVCCFTGHRKMSDLQRQEVRRKLEKTVQELIDNGVTEFICGGAIGFDMLAAHVIISKKAENPITLKLALPCRDQSKRWNSALKSEYEAILSCADEIIYMSDKYVTGCMHARDKYMVDNSDIVVAFYRGTTGGTQYTVQYARESEKQMMVV